MKKTLLNTVFAFIALSSISQTTAIPDANFEQALINLGYDTGPINGSVPTNNIDNVISLNLSALNINDLSGIEDFTSLTHLICAYNPMTSIDVSNNVNLATLYANDNNSLINLDVSGCVMLDSLICYFTPLVSLDLSNCLGLTYLNCAFNQLSSIDVTNNTALTWLWCSSNQISNIDVSQNTYLTYLNCTSNLLQELNVSVNTSLSHLECSSNNLLCLNVKNGNNNNLSGFAALNNPNLTCIEVDDVAYSTTNWTNIDGTMSFSLDCNNSCSSVSTNIENQSLSSLILYPNPAKDLLNITSNSIIESIKVYDIYGRIIISKNYHTPFVSLNVDQLSNGIYSILINNLQIRKFNKN